MQDFDTKDSEQGTVMTKHIIIQMYIEFFIRLVVSHAAYYTVKHWQHTRKCNVIYSDTDMGQTYMLTESILNRYSRTDKECGCRFKYGVIQKFKCKF